MSDTKPTASTEVYELDVCFNNPQQLICSVRAILDHAKSDIAERLKSGEHASQLVRDLSNLTDTLLLKLWHHYIAPEDDDIALIAVGGYGRKELHPGSDIDLLILLREDSHQDYNEAISQFLTLLWDLKIDVGHSVRSLSECASEAEKDITIATNLMEARLLAGENDLFDTMTRSVSPEKIWSGKLFFEAKWQEQIQRYEKFHDAVYNLEPNIKEGPGGLRDIQMIGWVAKRHFGATTLHDLVHHRFLTEDEYTSLMEGQEFLWRIRLGLHTLTKRREDRLLFDYQKALAELFGYQQCGHRLAVEEFMKDYYTVITELNRLNEMLLQLFREEILLKGQEKSCQPLNNRFQIRHGFITAKNDTIFRRYPFALLEVFLLLQQNPQLHGVTAETIRLIRANRNLINDKFRKDWRNRTLFLEILRQPRGVTHQLRRMNRYGILAQYIPAFGKIVGLMQYDLFHAYTVDEHTLMVLRNLRRLSVPSLQHEKPLCSKVAKKTPKLELLYIAGLFHDIAKGRGGDHSKLGAKDALDFCLDHGLSNYDSQLVSWLVESHLIFSTTAQRQDISDPDVINAFASAVGDQTRLDYLFLLTVADICGTNPEIWNSWKDSLLSQLYHSTLRALRRGLECPIDKSEHLNEIQTEASALLTTLDVNTDDIKSIWTNFDEDYFLRHSAEEIAWHTSEICATKELPLVLLREDSQRGATSIFMYIQDQDYLFATITKLLDEMGLSILDARIITTQSGFVLDTFIVLDAKGEPIRDERQIDNIISRLLKALSQINKQDAPSKRRMPRRLKHFHIPTDITFSSDIVNNRTIMELVAADRPGFLAYIGKTLIQCKTRLHNAKISTMGERIEDIFYITDLNNQPLSEAHTFECLKKNLKKFLDGQRD